MGRRAAVHSTFNTQHSTFPRSGGALGVGLGGVDRNHRYRFGRGGSMKEMRNVECLMLNVEWGAARLFIQHSTLNIQHSRGREVHLVSDLVALIGTIDIVLGEVDR